jgi:hypothetical protein
VIPMQCGILYRSGSAGAFALPSRMRHAGRQWCMVLRLTDYRLLITFTPWRQSGAPVCDPTGIARIGRLARAGAGDRSHLLRLVEPRSAATRAQDMAGIFSRRAANAFL